MEFVLFVLYFNIVVYIVINFLLFRAARFGDQREAFFPAVSRERTLSCQNTAVGWFPVHDFSIVHSARSCEYCADPWPRQLLWLADILRVLVLGRTGCLCSSPRGEVLRGERIARKKKTIVGAFSWLCTERIQFLGKDRNYELLWLKIVWERISMILATVMLSRSRVLPSWCDAKWCYVMRKLSQNRRHAELAKTILNHVREQFLRDFNRVFVSTSDASKRNFPFPLPVQTEIFISTIW